MKRILRSFTIVAVVLLLSCTDRSRGRAVRSEGDPIWMLTTEISNFGDFLSGIAHRHSQHLVPVTLDDGSGNLVHFVVGTEFAYGGRFPDDPFVIDLRGDGIRFGGKNFTSGEISDAMRPLIRTSELSGSEVVPVLCSRVGTDGEQAHATLGKIVGAGIKRFRIGNEMIQID